MNQQQHIVSLMNSTGVCQRTNSGDLVGMYTTFQIGQILAQHSSVEAAERVAAVPLTNTHAELQTATEEIAYLKQQCEKSNQQGILAAKERDDANGMVERQAANIEELLRENEALKAQAASAESERDINYRNWQTAQGEFEIANELYETTLAERNEVNGKWYETSAKLRNLDMSFEKNAIAHSNCLREIEVITAIRDDLYTAWQKVTEQKAQASANYRAAHNEMQRQERRAIDAETELASIKAQQQFQGKT